MNLYKIFVFILETHRRVWLGIIFWALNKLLKNVGLRPLFSNGWLQLFVLIFPQINYGMLVLQAEFDEDIFLQYWFMILHCQNKFRQICGKPFGIFVVVCLSVNWSFNGGCSKDGGCNWPELIIDIEVSVADDLWTVIYGPRGMLGSFTAQVKINNCCVYKTHVSR